MNVHPKTFRGMLTRNLLVAGTLMASATLAGGIASAAPERPDLLPSPTAVESLLEEHGCWSGEAPADMAGKFPGHVVVTINGGDPVYAGGPMVGRALDHVFKGKHPNLTVNGFCR